MAVFLDAAEGAALSDDALAALTVGKGWQWGEDGRRVEHLNSWENLEKYESLEEDSVEKAGKNAGKTLKRLWTPIERLWEDP